LSKVNNKDNKAGKNKFLINKLINLKPYQCKYKIPPITIIKTSLKLIFKTIKSLKMNNKEK